MSDSARAAIDEEKAKLNKHHDTSPARQKETDEARRFADAMLAGARKAKASDEQLLPYARDRLDAWREWGFALGPAEPGGNPKGRRTSESDRASDSDYKDRQRARAIAKVPAHKFEEYKAADKPDQLTLAGLLNATAAQKDRARKERGEQRREKLREENQAAVRQGEAVIVHGDFREHATTQHGAALLLVDPPYGMDYKSGFRWDSEHDAIRHDDPASAAALVDDMFELVLPTMIEDAHILIFCQWRTESRLIRQMHAAGLDIRSSIVWVKNEPGMGDLTHSFGPMHERIIHATRGNATMRYREADVIQCPRVVSAHHPTEKPVPLLERLILATTDPGQLVIDPMAGIGSALVAAVHTGRNGWGCEIDARHHEIATGRLDAIQSAS